MAAENTAGMRREGRLRWTRVRWHRPLPFHTLDDPRTAVFLDPAGRRERRVPRGATVEVATLEPLDAGHPVAVSCLAIGPDRDTPGHPGFAGAGRYRAGSRLLCIEGWRSYLDYCAAGPAPGYACIPAHDHSAVNRASWDDAAA